MLSSQGVIFNFSIMKSIFSSTETHVIINAKYILFSYYFFLYLIELLSV